MPILTPESPAHDEPDTLSTAERLHKETDRLCYFEKLEAEAGKMSGRVWDCDAGIRTGR